MRLGLFVFIGLLGGIARGDEVRCGGFRLTLPKQIGWEQEKKGDLVLLTDETDKLPEITILFFLPRTKGSAEAVLGQLSGELERQGAQGYESVLAHFQITKRQQTEALAGARVLRGEGVVSEAGAENRRVVYAILERGDSRLVAVGVPKSGIFERGAVNFDHVVHGLEPVEEPKGGESAGRSAFEPMPPMAAVKEVTGSSSYEDKRHRDRYAPWRALLYSSEESEEAEEPTLTSMWCEGRPDEGIGEGVTIHFAAPTELDRVRIASGVWKSERLWSANNRPTALEVVVDNRAPLRVEVPTKRAWVEARLKGKVTSLTVRIAAVNKGRINDSCLSAIDLLRGKERLVPLLGVDERAVAELPKALPAIEAALDAPQLRGLDAWIEFPFSNHASNGFFQNNDKVVTYANWPELVKACRAWRAAEEREPDDLSRPYTCPLPAPLDDELPAPTVRGVAPGAVEVTFASHREVNDLWRLRWTAKGWRLVAIDYR